MFPYSDRQIEMGTEIQVLQGNMRSEVVAYIENLVFSSICFIIIGPVTMEDYLETCSFKF